MSDIDLREFGKLEAQVASAMSGAAAFVMDRVFFR
jgi:hypothetical protein